MNLNKYDQVYQLILYFEHYIIFVVSGTFSFFLVYYECYTTCGVPINLKLTIIQGPNDWQYIVELLLELVKLIKQVIR